MAVAVGAVDAQLASLAPPADADAAPAPGALLFPSPSTPAAALARGAPVSEFSVAGRTVTLSTFRDETQLDDVMALIARDLSEPYSVFTYRHFVDGWPGYTVLAHAPPPAAGAPPRLVGVIICKAEVRPRSGRVRGYVAMLAVEKDARRAGLGRELAVQVLHRMAPDCDELVLETEVTNTPALRLYESLGFFRDKRLGRYYLNGNCAWRLKVVLA
jgi:peptide alpha-N-acetyltransferase